MVSNINDAFMKFERRAEGKEAQKLVETFVDVGPLFTLLGGFDHQVVQGRRGTGKTHALTYLAETKRSGNNISIYCDLRSVGSNTSVYGDPTRDLSERATRLLIDVLTAVHEKLLEFCVATSEQNNLSITGPLLDALSNGVGEVKVVGTAEVERKGTTKEQGGDQIEFGLSGGLNSLSVSAKTKESVTKEKAVELRTKDTGMRIYYVHFGSVMAALQRLLDAMQGMRVWIMLDEWSTVPIDLQPYLADLMRRCIFPVKGVTVKIGAIEQRTKFKIDLPAGQYIGLEIGGDVPSEINLDDFMVFENQPEKARSFYKQLFFKHFGALENASAAGAPASADQLLANGFTQVNVFDEFVQAAEGVPRDAMNIISLAATRALDDKIGMKHVRDAARDWYQRGKERDLVANEECVRLLRYIVDEVIGQKSARAFLLRSNVRNSVIDDLFDARVIHVLKRNISGKDTPGERFDVYKIDYGCYVELLNTGKAPTLLLDVDGAEDAGIPQDDYRSIRRAILDLDHFISSKPS